MHGDRRPYPVVLITLDAEQIIPWARQQGLPYDIGPARRPPGRARALIQPVIAEVNAAVTRQPRSRSLSFLTMISRRKPVS